MCCPTGQEPDSDFPCSGRCGLEGNRKLMCRGPFDGPLEGIGAAGWVAGWMVTYDPVVDVFAIDGTDPSTSGEFPSHDGKGRSRKMGLRRRQGRWLRVLGRRLGGGASSRQGGFGL